MNTETQPRLPVEASAPMEIPINENLREAMNKTAEQIVDYSLDVKAGDRVLIKLSAGEYSHQLYQIVSQKIRDRQATPILRMMMPSMSNNSATDNVLIEGVSQGADSFALPKNAAAQQFASESDKQAAFFHYGPGTDEVNDLLDANKLLIIRSRVSDKNPGKDPSESIATYDVDPGLKKSVTAMGGTLTDWRLETTSINPTSTLERWCLVVPPTPEAPVPKDMTPEEFAKLYFDACDLNWEEVGKAQAVLVELLSGKQQIEIAVPAPAGLGPEWNTKITLSTKDQRFANSGAMQNMPGSEVFAAPTKGTLNGIFAVPNPVWFQDRVIPNLRLELKDGKVVKWHSDAKGKDHDFIEQTLATDDGASIIGEIGFGTNKKVNIPPPDTMMAEKAFGIHLALGSSHPQKTYLYEPVQLDNGNRSAIHIDIPRLMLPAFGGGTMIVDGQKIFENGQYLDERLAVLNPDLKTS